MSEGNNNNRRSNRASRAAARRSRASAAAATAAPSPVPAAARGAAAGGGVRSSNSSATSTPQSSVHDDRVAALDARIKRGARGSAAGKSRPTQPGAVAVSNPSPSGERGGDARRTTDMLERDVLAKSRAAGAGASAVSGRGPTKASGRRGGGGGAQQQSASTVRSLEQDVLAKQRGKGARPPASRPGAVAESSGGAKAATDSLEQDVLAKQRGKVSRPPASRPGAVAESGGDAKAATDSLEQDVLAKQRGKGARPSSRPGAVATSGTGDARAVTDSLEQDVLAKQQGRGPRPASRPGAVSASTSGARASINALEQDVLAKQQGRGSTASRPGAVSESGAAPAGKAAMRRYREQGSRTGAAPTGVGAVPTRGGEDRGAAKASGRTARQSAVASAAAASVTAGSADARTMLNTLEDDVLSKSKARPGSSEAETTIDPAAAKLRGSGAGPSASTSAASGLTSVRTAGTLGPAPSELSNFESEVIAKTRRGGQQGSRTSSRGGEGASVDSSRRSSGRGGAAVAAGAAAGTAVAGAAVACNAYGEPIVQQQQQHQQRPSHYDNNRGYHGGPSHDGNDAPVEEYPAVQNVRESVDMPVDESGEIQAFVADTVVDATGVAVVMSEEDEEKEERRNYMKKGLIAALAIAAIVIGVSVPLTLKFTTGDTIYVEKSSSPTLSPTSAPTMAPTAMPTPDDFPAMIDVLFPISGSALYENGTPQNRALDWIARNDGANRSPSDPRFVQRYALAVFYYSTGGAQWLDCFEGDQCTRGSPWLSSDDECLWGGIVCVDESDVFTINMGEVPY